MPSNILNKQNETIFETLDWDDYRIAYYVAKSGAKDTDNEDTFFITTFNNNLILGVADGAGGHPLGEEASRIVAEELVKSENKVNFERTETIDAIDQANTLIRDLKVGARTTCSAAFLTNDNVSFCNIGDSEAVYWSSTGNVLYSNIPDSATGYMVEAEQISQEDALLSPERNLVSNMLGDEIIRIEATGEIELKKGHTFVLGTDGLFDNLSHEALGDVLAGGNFDESFAELVKKCEERSDENWNKEDDIAFVVVRKMRSQS
jgi:serine/threonine protein phosphatase PrpC